MEQNEEKSANADNNQQEVTDQGEGHTPLQIAHGSNSDKAQTEKEPHCCDWNRVAKISGWTKFSAVAEAFFGAALLGAAVAQIFVYSHQARTMDNQLRETRLEDRAWIAPITATSPVPKLHTGLDVAIHFVNTGKEPATSAKFVAEAFWRTDPAEPNFHPNKTIDTYITACRKGKVRMEPLGMVYPTANGPQRGAHARFHKGFVDQSVIQGTKLLVVAGCFRYGTQGERHSSGFCFDWKAGAETSNNWFFCSIGNDGD